MARAEQPKPKIHKRSEWNARAGGGLRYPRPLSGSYYRITAHHDASSAPAGMTLAQALRQVKGHQEQHLAQGWSDIGYHYLIAPGGQIIEGRPLDIQGAHTLNNRGSSENGGNVGICAMGELHKHQPTPQQLAAFQDLHAWLCWYLDIDSSALRGHQDYMATACPGSLQYKLDATRTETKRRLVHGAPEGPAANHDPVLEVDGEILGSVIIVDGVSYAPVRALAERLGKTVSFDPSTKTITVV